MPRLSVRRGLFSVGIAASCVLFIVNFQQRDLSLSLLGSAPAGGSAPGAASLARLRSLAAEAPGAVASRNGSGLSRRDVLPNLLDQPSESMEDQARRRAASVKSFVDGPQPERRGRDWFFQGGVVRPQPDPAGLRSLALWPEEDSGDRIVNQLRYMPPPTRPEQTASKEQGRKRLKTILLYDGFGARLKTGQEEFLRNACPVNTCEITTSRSRIDSVDAVLFKDRFTGPRVRRNPHQVWIMYLLECPLHTASFKHETKFNWTATYRHDSDIVAPYEKWVYYDDAVRFQRQDFNFAANKTKKVAWFVSNCGASNNRLQYAKTLAKYIEVDIYGSCGTKKCPRSMARKCFEKLNTDYKFYLAFENSNCRDYITEKFFVNGLQHNVLPIVMGAHPEDYARAAPEHSFIHVDDFQSPKELAEFLHTLDRDDHLYNSYFQWKGTGEFINTYFFCRLCAALHDTAHRRKVIPDLNTWWRATGTCVNGKWSQPARTL